MLLLPPSLWQQRREALDQSSHSPILLAQLPAGFSPLTDKRALPASALLSQTPRAVLSLPLSQQKQLPAFLKQISPRYVDLSEIYIPSNYKEGDPFIIHVQDAHQQTHAQKNIAAVLDEISAALKNQPLLIGIEGAQGDFTFEQFRRLTNEKNIRYLAEHFLKKNYLTGAEYYGLTNNTPPSYWGIEDGAIYLQHVQAFADAVKLEKEAQKQQAELVRQTEQEKIKIFNSELKQFDALVQSYQSGKITISLYVKELVGNAKLPKQSHLKRFLDAYEVEQTLDVKKVMQEQQGLLALMKKNTIFNTIKRSYKFRSSLSHAANFIGNILWCAANAFSSGPN